MKNRSDHFKELFPDEPKFRLKQIQKAIFDSKISEWNDITTLSKYIRQDIQEIPFYSYKDVEITEQEITYKALLTLLDDEKVETVLMKNAKENWTICLSSQVGCAMKCSFCATGKLGLTRHLFQDEIVDQIRFWQRFLQEKNIEGRISNIVVMGMGEPMANYENVRNGLNAIIENTDIGPTKITVSSVGLLPQLEKMIDDKDWPRVKIAISLHAPNDKLRKQIMPSSLPNFFERFDKWVDVYFQKYATRNTFLTIEYIMLQGINDREEHAIELAQRLQKFPNTKVNLIPYNSTESDEYQTTEENEVMDFQEVLLDTGLTTTIRKSLGGRINAACGQLALNKK